MNASFHRGLAAAVCLLLLPCVQAQVQVMAFDHAGLLEWTNELPHAQSFDVEWSGPLTEGTWQSSWNGLAGIPATAATYCVKVPMSYRIVTHTNILRSRWTLMYYLDGDNDLESDFIPKFIELGRWNSDTNVQIVVQFARNGRDTRYGNWHSCERYYVTNDMVPTQESAMQDWGDGLGGRMVNMGDPATLTAFIDWTAARYPADHYALLIGNHGFGWNGLCISWSYAKSILYLSDLRAALQTASAPVECLFLDACHMNMVETITELQYTDLHTVLGSETYGQTDWPYGWMIEGLQEHPDWTAGPFASDVNERLWEYYSVSNVVEKITLCTTDMSLVPSLVTNTAWFVTAALDTNVPLAELQDRARMVMSAITTTLPIHRLGSDWNDIAFGLAVYFPLKNGTEKPQSFDEYTARRTLFSAETGWRDLLEAYYDPMSHPPCHSQVFSARAAITNYLDYGGDEHIDLYNYCRQFTNAPP
ncbi:MAG: clostripain-related cysteine peptidase [Lentisphaerota bacterium]